MSRLPVCSGQDAIRAFQKLGYQVDHQTGSHIILRHPQMRRLTVPNHRELAKGTMRALIREAGLTKDEFVKSALRIRTRLNISAVIQWLITICDTLEWICSGPRKFQGKTRRFRAAVSALDFGGPGRRMILQAELYEYEKTKTAMPNSKISPKVLAELNRQLNQELNAAQEYLALSFWCKLRNFTGFTGFFATQSAEEREHAAKFARHLLDRGTAPELAAIPAPKQVYKTLLEVALRAQAMEQANTQGIHAAYEAALAAKDLPAQVLLHWFINEQVEEEAWAAEMVDRVQGATCAGSLSDLDRHIERYLAGDKKAG